MMTCKMKRRRMKWWNSPRDMACGHMTYCHMCLSRDDDDACVRTQKVAGEGSASCQLSHRSHSESLSVFSLQPVYASETKIVRAYLNGQTACDLLAFHISSPGYFLSFACKEVALSLSHSSLALCFFPLFSLLLHPRYIPGRLSLCEFLRAFQPLHTELAFR